METISQNKKELRLLCVKEYETANINKNNTAKSYLILNK